jgi:hypothetical protein
MAIPQASVQGKFSAKFGKVNLPKTFKENLIKKIANKLDSEDEIDSTLDAYEDVITEAASELDRTRTELTKKVEKKDVVEQPAPSTEPPADADPLTKQMFEQMKTINDALQGILNKDKVASLADRFKKDERLKDIPESFIKLALPKTEEEYESQVTALTDSYSQFAEKNRIEAIGADAPIRSTGAKGVTEKIVDNEIKNWAASRVPQPQK